MKEGGLKVGDRFVIDGFVWGNHFKKEPATYLGVAGADIKPQKYSFRTNNFNTQRVVDDALADGKDYFLVIGRNNCLFGMLKIFKSVKEPGASSYMSGYAAFYDNTTGKFCIDGEDWYEQPYWLHICDRKEIPKLIESMKTMKKMEKKRKEGVAENLKPKRDCKEKSTQFEVITL